MTYYYEFIVGVLEVLLLSSNTHSATVCNLHFMHWKNSIVLNAFVVMLVYHATKEQIHADLPIHRYVMYDVLRKINLSLRLRTHRT